MGGIDEIDDPNVGLGSVLPMQPPGVLLQRAFPGHRVGGELLFKRLQVTDIAHGNEISTGIGRGQHRG